MKKLVGMKQSFSSLENQQLTNLQAVTGGRSAQQCNFTNERGQPDADVYDDNGQWVGRVWGVYIPGGSVSIG